MRAIVMVLLVVLASALLVLGDTGKPILYTRVAKSDSSSVAKNSREAVDYINRALNLKRSRNHYTRVIQLMA